LQIWLPGALRSWQPFQQEQEKKLATDIPPEDDPIWQNLLTGKIECNFDQFAAKLLQSALARNLSEDPSATNLRKCCQTLREFFVKNAEQPAVTRDLNKMTRMEP
jgi:hypothetical protein